MEGRRGTKHSLSVQKERKSQYVCLSRVEDKTAEQNIRAIEKSLSPFPGQIRLSITYDNGSENTRHEKLNEILGTRSYFCDPYSSWQKGSVENVIGLVREYLPKGTDLSEVTDKEIKAIQDKLNHRPRECLGYKTPHEVLYKKLKSLGVRIGG